MYLDVLENMGLSTSEIRLYLALLKRGVSTSGPLITDTNMQSSVVHRVLKSLIAKGLISYVTISNNRHYQAATPSDLVSFLDNKRKQLLEVLPQLQSISAGAQNRNNVEMFLGKKAIFSMLNTLVELGKQGDEYFSFSLIDDHDSDDVVRFYKQFNVRRREKKLDVKVLANKRVKSLYEKHYTKELLSKAFVRYTSFNFPQGLIIFLNKVIFLNWGIQPTAIVVTNDQMAQQYRKFFLEFYESESDAYPKKLSTKKK